MKESWENGLTTGQALALKAVADGILPPIKAPQETTDTNIVEYWEHELSKDNDFMQVLAKIVLTKLTPTNKVLLLGVLTCLSSIPGTILLVGSIKSSHAFVDWSLEDRIDGLQRMQHSSLLQRRQAYQSLKRLVCNVAFTYHKKNTGTNPFLTAIGYPGSLLKEGNGQDRPAKDLVSPDIDLIWDLKLEDLKYENGNYSFECDCVVVGSGAGGGVAADILSKAGYSVVVLEKGPYIPPEKLSSSEGKAFDELYEGHGLVSSLDGNFMILAGSTLGGGTTVNWSCCLPTPDSVREEWVQQHNLPQFSPQTKEFDKSLQAVYEDMNVTTDARDIRHNVNNTKLIESCETLGYKWNVTGQNVDTEDAEGASNISFGDRFGVKRDGRVSYLQRAVKNGTRILDRCEVLRILKVQSNEACSGEKASGVLCKRDNQVIQVKARRGVVLAAGSLHSPCILRKSGFKNKHIGQHLRLHPATGVSARLPDQVNCFKGAPMTVVCDEFKDGPLNNGYGAKIECPSMHPGIAATAAQCINPSLFRTYMLDYSKALPLIVLQRDSSEGQVRLGFDGFPYVDYTLNSHDKQSMMAAMKGAMKIFFAAGAEECGTTHIRDLGMKPDQLKVCNKDELDQIDKRGMKECELSMFSAHQMGTCRMSSSPSSGVVDSNGETWECDNVVVVDASVFPTATAVNPMMTVLAMSHMLCQRFALRLQHEDQCADCGPEAEAIKVMREAETMEVKRQTMRKKALPWFRSDVSSLMLVSPESWRLLIQASAPVVALFWFYCKNKPLLRSH